jgi:5-methyltetrahydrofolate--homocysteine methyltransferase
MIRNKKSNPKISSALKAVDLKQQPPPLIIGERLNTQGSKKAKEMVLSNDFDGLLNIARRQVEDGAHCLDVCVATTERSDELEFMTTLVKRLSLEIDVPLAIDSTDPKVIEAAIRQIPGKPIINSINLEGDGTRFHLLAPLMVKYGVPAIAMCIGPRGMAKTSQEKLDTALLLLETGKKYGLQSWQFIFDVLTFTLATGEPEFLDSAKATLEGIRLVKRNIPDSFTTLGLSNISFGLPLQARKIINSVFLYYAVKSGLDSVIINAKDIIPYTDIDPIQRNLAESLIFNKHSNALSDLISYFQKSGISLSTSSTKKLDIDPAWDPSKKSYFRIVNRLKEGIESDVVSAIAMRVRNNSNTKGKAINEKSFPQKDENNDQLGINTPNTFSEGIEDPYQVLGNVDKEEAHQAAVQTLNEVLLPAMKEVGDKFGAGELILPFVLKSAECMKAAVAELEKYLIKQEGVSKGKLVLCTVYGDVHDIGKNLVKTIFVNNGYTVYDLGKQVPIQQIVEKIKEVNADAVGLSALLVSTSKQMQYFVEHARKNNIQIPVLCGGAAINSNYINRIAKDKQSIYSSGVFYCKTAFDGLRTMNKLMSKEKNQFISTWYRELEEWEARIQQRNLEYDNATQRMRDGDIAKSDIVPVVAPPTPPHINERVRLDSSQIDLNDAWKYINKKSLFVLSWGIRGKAAEALVKEPDLLLEEWKERVLKENLFEQSVVYGYFRCHNIKNKLVVDTPENDQVIFDFPRSSQKKHLCLTDYFGKDDIVAFQAVTVGNKVTNIISDWNKAGLYTDAYYLHGLAVETAEALAEWVNFRIRRELKINHRGGLRYSWGYPSCPDISQHKLVWKILDPAKSGMTLTELGQIIPDQSTAAIVVHHPDAEYFVL